MKTIKRHSRLFALLGTALGGALVAIVLVTYLGAAMAQSFPGTDPLWYAGTLTDTSGKPLTSPQTVGIDVWKSATSTTSTDNVCSVAATSTTLTQGHFRIKLGSTCVTAIRDNPELWVEITVGSTKMARTKVGSVPYVASMPEEMKKSGDASFTIHSNTDTPTSGKKMLSLKTGKTGPKEVFSVNNNGTCGIGTTPTSNWNSAYPALQVGASGVLQGSAAAQGFVLGSNYYTDASDKWKYLGTGKASAINFADDIHFYVTDTTGVANGALSFATAATITTTGNVGIGTTSPAGKLHVVGDVLADASGSCVKVKQGSFCATNLDTALTISTDSAGTDGIYFKTYSGGYYDRMVIKSNGNVGIGTTGPTSALSVVGNIYATGTITQGSSRKLKERIRELATSDAQAAVNNLKPTRFYYKADKSDEHLGFIAEDVPALLATKDRKGVDPMDVAAVLTKVVQQQQQQLETQKKAFAEQRREIEELKKQVQQLKRPGG